MSLLEKATLITTPTAHSNGTLHSIKGGAVADFDVVRGSAATRVNAEGLIEDISILSGELVTNGDFATDSNWLKTGETTISGGYGNIISTTGASSELKQTILQIGATYKYSVEVVSISYGGIQIFNGSPLQIATSIGTYTGTFVATNVQFRLIRNGVTNGSIDNISVKEVIDATNIPRIDYTTGEGVVLLEPQSTNLITYSEDFSQWGAINSTILSDDAISPSGIQDADRVTATSTGNGAFVRDTSVTQSTSTTYSFSCFVKKGTTNFVRLANRAIGGQTTASAWFDVQNGVLGTLGVDLSSSKIEDFGSGWYKCTATGVTESGTIVNQLLDIAASASDGATGAVIGDFMYIWGAQLEALPYSTSYIPTSGAIATRLADSVTGAGDATTFNSTEGVLYFEGSAINNDSTNKRISLSDSGSANRIILTFANNTINYRLVSGGLLGANIVYNSDTTINKKYAITWKLNEFKFWVNGIQVGTNTNGAVFPSNTLSEFNLAGFSGISDPFYGKVKALAVFNEALTDAELLCLTTI